MIKIKDQQHNHSSFSMTKSTKLYLALAIICLFVGLVFHTGLYRPVNLPVIYVVLPLGVVFSGMFLVFRLLEKQS